MPTDELFSREEALGGLPARRAGALLFLIESRAAYLAAQSRRAMERFLTEEAAKERDLAYLEAFSLARQPPRRATLQDLERFAPQWASLVPERPALRAAVARALGLKYTLIYRAVPRLRAALGLDGEAVQAAYRRQYGEPLEALYAARPGLADRLRWAGAAVGDRLERLSPFWTSFAMTLTETVGAGILALPIAVARVGPLAGVALLIVLGLVNLLTIAFMTEALTRSGTIRYGGGFLGRAVDDYLGRAGSLVLTVGLVAINVLSLVAYYVGFATTLADATPIPAPVWVGGLFVVGLYFLRRESLDATVASALLIGAINIGLIVILSLLALTHLKPANLAYVDVPFLGGRPFDPSLLQLIFGVIATAYFGHTSASNCARVVLRRDASGRSLMGGAAAAQGVAILLYCLWVVVVNGAIDPDVLASEPGTALVPLAKEVGPSVRVLGSILAILAMGMASIHMVLGLFNVVHERLPARHQPTVTLARRRGQLIWEKGRGQVRLSLTYLGLAGTPQFRLDVQLAGRTHRQQVAVAGRWDAAELRDRVPGWDKQGFPLAFEVLSAEPAACCLRLASPLRPAYTGEWDVCGLGMGDLLSLPDPLPQLAAWMMRQGEVSLAAAAVHLGQDREHTRAALATLVAAGFVQERGGERAPRYRVLLAAKGSSRLPQQIWQALDGEAAPAVEAAGRSPRRHGWGAFVAWLADLAASELGRWVLAVSPAAAIFVLVEWLFFAGAESFTGPLSFLGVIVASLLGGLFPVLLLVSSRRKGELVPGVVYRFLGNPVLLVCISLLSLGNLFLHGLVIWQGAAERAIALSIGVLMLGLTVVMVRRGAFSPRLVVELRGDQRPGEQPAFAIVAAGQPATAEVRLGYPAGEQVHHAAAGEVANFARLQQATFDLPRGQATELKVWAHTLTAVGDSEGLPARLEVRQGEDTAQFDLGLSGGQAVTPIDGERVQATLTL